MINKQSLWFLTLFSLILVLSLYYITMPSEMLLTNNNVETKEKVDNTKTTVKESEILVSLRVEADEERSTLMETYQAVLTDEKKSTEEKNNAYESLKELNVVQGKENELESKIKKEFSLNSFIKINNDDIKVVVASTKHSYKLANDIMVLIQKEFTSKKYITVQFQ